MDGLVILKYLLFEAVKSFHASQVQTQVSEKWSLDLAHKQSYKHAIGKYGLGAAFILFLQVFPFVEVGLEVALTESVAENLRK